MVYKNRLFFDTAIATAHTSIGAAYATVGSPISNPIYQMYLYNATDGDVALSTDGTNDHIVLPTGGSLSLPVSNGANFLFPAQTQFYLKDGPSAPTSGSYYISLVLVES